MPQYTWRKKGPSTLTGATYVVELLRTEPCPSCPQDPHAGAGASSSFLCHLLHLSRFPDKECSGVGLREVDTYG